jgi:hypothetical protein
VEPGAYRGIAIEAGTNDASWLMINEVNISSNLGSNLPAGTIATGVHNTSYIASNVLDNNEKTYFNAGSNMGSLNLKFPAAISIGSLIISANAYPASNITYMVYAKNADGTWVDISSPSKVSVPWHDDQDPSFVTLDVDNGTYKEIKVMAMAPESWIAISNVYYSGN